MVQGSNPKHTVLTFIVNFCTIFVIVLRKRTKINKEGPGIANKDVQIDNFFMSLYREIFAPDIVYVYTCIFVP